MSAVCHPGTTLEAAPAFGVRLLFVTATAANVRQGSGTYVGIAALRSALLAAGHDVSLIAPAAATASAPRRLWFNYRLRRRLAAAADGCDAWVGFDLDGIFLRPAGVRNIASIKGVLAEELRFERGAQRASLCLQAWFEGRRARRADCVIATSRYAAGAIEALYRVPGSKIRIVPELIDLAAWNARLAAAAPESRPGNRPPRLLCVAHLYPRKDVATLLRAVARMRTAAEVHIVGDGPELAALRRRAAELGLASRVAFLGHVNLARLAQEYRNADVFCLPSRQEGFGIVLLEAMAAGVPIVAARAAAIPEVLAEGECGRLFLPGDADALAAQLDAILEDAPARAALAAAGRRRVRRYDAPGVAAEFLAAAGIDFPGFNAG